MINYFTTVHGCSCADWRWRGRCRPCKHVRALRAAYELVAAQESHNMIILSGTPDGFSLEPGGNRGGSLERTHAAHGPTLKGWS